MNTSVYPDDMKLKDALPVYFAKYHFSEQGYTDRFFRIKLGPLFIPFPNTKGRIKAVKLHDLHHILTGYTALWKGEVEIGAWEIAAGCGKFIPAWVLNFGSFGVGLFLYPRALLAAFLYGRRMKTSLYYNYVYNDLLLEKNGGRAQKRNRNRAATKEFFS